MICMDECHLIILCMEAIIVTIVDGLRNAVQISVTNEMKAFFSLLVYMQPRNRKIFQERIKTKLA